MATDSINMRPPIMSYMGYVGRGVGLLIVLTVAGLAFVFNYWVGISLLFLGFLVWILFSFKDFQGRNLLLLVYTLAFVMIISSSLAYTFSATETTLSQGSIDQSALASSLLVGIGVSLVAFILFLFIIVVAALGVLKWHKYQDVSFFQAFLYLLSVTLGLRYLWIVVDDKEVKGDEADKKRLETFGGPGWLTVHPGHVVVLHHWGKITRVVAAGSTMLKRHEKIKAVLPLEPVGGINPLESVLTKDRVPLTINLLHAVRLEPAKVTKGRGGIAKDDRIIGDDYDQCYESVARLAAHRAPDMWGAVKNKIANSVRDLIMTYEFEELFSIGQDDDSQGLEFRANQRKLAEIEKSVAKQAAGFGLSKGLMLLLVDINGIEYPEEIKEKINKQLTAHLDLKIRKDEAEARKFIAKHEAETLEIQAGSEETAAEHKANAMVKLAQGEAQAERITEEAKAKARAGYYKHIIAALREQNRSDQTINTILENSASSSAMQDQMARIIKIISHKVTSEAPKQINSGNNP